jgi:hypothetical protein
MGLNTDNASVRMAVSLHLGIPVIQPCVCVSGSMVMVNTPVNDLLCRAFIGASALMTREPHSLSSNIGKRRDGVTRIPLPPMPGIGKDLSRHMPSHTYNPAATAELRKVQKYSETIAGVTSFLRH